MSEPAPRLNRALLYKLGVAVVVLAVAAVLVARGLDLKGLMARGQELIRDAGPVVFFGAMAVLPAFGAPLSPFSLTAGSVFGPSLGMPLVIAFALVAVFFNIMFSYLLARRAFRPLLESLVVRLGYKLPEVAAGDVTDLIILVRVTPGVPFPIQNYLLGLARVPVGKYALISCTIQGAFNVAFILFGEALLQGKGKLALLGLSGVVALSVGAHLLRKHYGAKKTPAG
ncbi:MAG TPA: VTT domain-containing protein [Lacunisphaera sp.]|nr:VTT domain-containing protein [Lacunisphaera sp.]